MTEEETAVYEAAIDRAVAIVTQDPTEAKRRYYAPELLLEDIGFVPDQPGNCRLIEAMQRYAAKVLPYTMREFKTAMNQIAKRWKAEQQRMDRAAVQQETLAAGLGVVIDPNTLDERQYARMFIAHRGYSVGYDRQFFVGPRKSGESVSVIDIMNDALLTASTLALIKPKGDVLSATNIVRAIEEQVVLMRIARRDEVQKALACLPCGRDRAAVDLEFREVCELLFVDAPFAEAAIRNYIWAVKRHFVRIEIEDHRMLVLYGPQKSGKTAFCRLLLKVLDDLASECSIGDVLDTRQMDLMQFYGLFPDELSNAERAEIQSLKSFITGGSPARRPMRSNIAEKTPIRATLIATSNHTLGRIIFDESGMRRFVEIETKPEIGLPKWKRVAAFDFTSLWQSIDPAKDDPLLPFAVRLREQQEEMRNKGNVEQWIEDYEFSALQDGHHTKSRSNSTAEFYANDLYLIFREWEETYDAKYVTSVQRWGRDMKALIKQHKAPGWSSHLKGPKTVYCLDLLQQSTDAGEVIALLPKAVKA